MKEEYKYFWVRFGEEWTIGRFDATSSYKPWEIIASDEILSGDEFDKIGPEIIQPEWEE